MEVSIVARTAARWWRETISGGAKLDNGARDSGNAMAAVIAAMTQSKQLEGISDEAFSTFEGALAKIIDERIVKGGAYPHIGVDYGPDQILGEAAESAGIDPGMSLFPWKTNMSIEGEHIAVSCGYGAPWEDVPLLVE